MNFTNEVFLKDLLTLQRLKASAFDLTLLSIFSKKVIASFLLVNCSTTMAIISIKESGFILKIIVFFVIQENLGYVLYNDLLIFKS